LPSRSTSAAGIGLSMLASLAIRVGVRALAGVAVDYLSGGPQQASR
jgi:hypothetical protein